METTARIKAERAVDLFCREFPENPSYIEPAILPKGGTLLLGGLAKVGKSLMMMEFIRALTTATPLFGHSEFVVPERAKCLYVEAENGDRAVRNRGVRIFDGAPPGWGNYFYTVSKEPRLQLDTAMGIGHFRGLLDDHKPNVLILDPMGFMSNQDENKAEGVGRLFYVMSQFKKIREDTGMSIIISHHFGKKPWGQAAKGYDALSDYNFRGSSKWKDAPDSIITMHRKSEIKDVPHEAWKLDIRFILRHESSPNEMELEVNRNNDFRVNFTHEKTKLRPLKLVNLGQAKAAPERQGLLSFPGADVNTGYLK